MSMTLRACARVRAPGKGRGKPALEHIGHKSLRWAMPSRSLPFALPNAFLCENTS